METLARQLEAMGEYFAAGFFEMPDAGIETRFCRAFRRYYENCPMSYLEGSPLFPSGKINKGSLAVYPHYCRQFQVNLQLLEEKCSAFSAKEAYEAVEAFQKEHGWDDGWKDISTDAVDWEGWTHSTLNYRKILSDGINGYEKRVSALPEGSFRAALLDLIAGIKTYHLRALAYLRDIKADARLISALENVPMNPPKDAYEALVSVNFALYLDECDDIGRVDSWLMPYYRGEALESVMHVMLENLQYNGGWSIALGPDYSELTKQWLNASTGLARPMVELRVSENMPDELWELAVNKVLEGGGQPAFYNERVIQERLRKRLPKAPKEDIYEFCGVGCTETSFGGMTCSGGIDINLNVLWIFDKCLHEKLAECASFDEFYEVFTRRLRQGQDEVASAVNMIYNKKAKAVFAPIRTLFVDDCIDRQLGYYQGGARYTFAMPSDSGIPNTVDSLMAVKKLVFDEKLYSKEEFLHLLGKGDPAFEARLNKCPSYGMDDSEADALMHDLTSRFYEYYESKTLDMGLGILPTSHQFKRHTKEGRKVGATPDGRESGQALAESIDSVNGKAIKGPTGMLSSAVSFSQDRVYGIPVLNLSVTKKYDPGILRALIEGYFAKGGTQMQITCTSKEKLLAARKDPNSHRDLIVRVGGFSEFFHKLSDDLKDAVIARTMFE